MQGWILFALVAVVLGTPNQAASCTQPSACMPANAGAAWSLTGPPSFTPGTPLTITLTPPGAVSFPGFLLYAEGSTGARVGTWTLGTGIQAKTTCSGTPGSSITHDGPITYPAGGKTFEYIPPVGEPGPITFKGVGVLQFALWTNLIDLPIPIAVAPVPVPVAPVPVPIAPVPVPTAPVPVPVAPVPVPTAPVPVPTAPVPVPAVVPVPQATPVPSTPPPVPSAPSPAPVVVVPQPVPVTQPVPVPAAPTPVPSAPTPAPAPQPASVPSAPSPVPSAPTPQPIPVTQPTTAPSAPTTVPSAPTPVPSAPSPVPSTVPSAPTPVPAPNTVPGAPSSGPDLEAMGYTVTTLPCVDGSEHFFGYKPPTSSKRQAGNSSTIEMVIQGPTNGFIAVGFTDGTYSMVGSDAVIGWMEDATGLLHVGTYHLEAQLDSGIVSNPNFNVTDFFGYQVDGVTTIFFTRELNSGYNPITNDVLHLISSRGPNDVIEYHDNHRSNSMIIVNITSGETSSEISGNFYVKMAHGIIMSFSFTILYPAGIMMARFGKDLRPDGLWFKVHVAVQVGTTLVIIAGAIIGFVVVGPASEQFVTVGWHAYLGTVMVSIAIFNFLLGVFRPHFEPGEKVSTARKIFNVVHPWTGRILTLISIPQVIRGILLLDVPKWGLAIYIPVAVLLFVVFIILEVAKRRKADSGFERF